jgi:hypothetical protein
MVGGGSDGAIAAGGGCDGAVAESVCMEGKGTLDCVANSSKKPVSATPAQATRAGLRQKSRHD